MLRSLIVFPLFLGVAFVLSQELIYEPLIVPRLSTWKEIPVYWWVAAFAPEVIVCLAAALMTKPAKEWLSFCASGALVITTVQWVAGLLNQPGHSKVIEGGPLHFAVQLITVGALIFVFVASVRLARLAVLRAHAS